MNYLFLVTCSSSIGLIRRPAVESACGVRDSMALTGEERYGGILKVVAFPLLTKSKFAVSSSDSI